MSDEIVIVTPELSSGGIGDYTRRLIEYLPPIPALRLIVPKSGTIPAASLAQYCVEEIAPRTAALFDKLPEHDGKVFVQYSGYGFDRLGYPRWLIRALLDWKKKSRGFLAIMFHEIWTLWPMWNKNYLLQQLHRRDIGKLVRVADRVITNTSGHAEELAALWPRSEVQVLPVGSNIRRSAAGGQRQPGVGILFGLPVPRLRALQRMESELPALSAAKKLTKIIAIGPSGSPAQDREERARLTALRLSEGFERRGLLPEKTISELLSRAAFALWAQGGHTATKSGTFMACAAHSLNIISPDADVAKPEPLDLLISPPELLRGISAVELQSRAEKLRAWQERTAAWSHIAGEIARTLKIAMPTS